MATNKSDKSSVTAEKVVKRQKKQARREAKLMSEIEAAKKELKKAQKKQSKALARLESRTPFCTLWKHVWKTFVPKAHKLQPVKSQHLSRVKRPVFQRVRW